MKAGLLAKPLENRPIRILFVCLGNICRSPTAEGVLRHLAAKEAPGLALEIDSAGTADYHIGAPPDPRSQRAALRRGIDISGLRARQVDRGGFRALRSHPGDGPGEPTRAASPAAAQLAHADVKLFLDYAPGLRNAGRAGSLLSATPPPSRKCSISPRPLRAACSPPYRNVRSSQYRPPASAIDTGRVSTQAISRCAHRGPLQSGAVRHHRSRHAG